jgi:hypothetical protein
MSHVVGIDIEVSDLASLEAAAEQACDLIAVRSTEYDWWGMWLNDYHGSNAAYNMGFDPKAYGACEFALVQADSPVGLAEIEARKQGRRLTHDEVTALREKHYGKEWRTSTSKPYSIGVVKHKDKPGYRLAYDTMDGRLVQKIGGQSADKLRQHYAVVGAKRLARKKRYKVAETALENGDILLTIKVPKRS